MVDGVMMMFPELSTVSVNGGLNVDDMIMHS